jgi:hypothetical protein
VPIEVGNQKMSRSGKNEHSFGARRAVFALIELGSFWQKARRTP